MTYVSVMQQSTIPNRRHFRQINRPTYRNHWLYGVVIVYRITSVLSHSLEPLKI